MLLWYFLVMVSGSSGLEVGLIGNCGEQPCVAAVESSIIHVDVKGAIATGKLQQAFRGVANSHGEWKMKDTYFVFPIHAGTVVTGFTAEINGRFLQAQVVERHRAKEIYHSATKNSNCPAALAQHGFTRAENAMDLYRISLGNIPTRQTTFVNFSFVQGLPLQDSDMKNQGFLRLLLPAIVGVRSRYSPRPDESEKLLQAATHQMPSVRIHVTVQPLASVSSPSHGKVLTTQASKIEVHMRRWEDISNDFVLHIHFAPQETKLFRPRAVLEQDPQLKTWVAVAELVPRFSWDLLTNVEITILVDRSGSMQGRREHFARQALEHFIRSCPFQALVDIIGFGRSFERLFAAPVQLNDQHFQSALAHARSLEADLGGTELAAPLEHVLNRKLKDGLHRRVLVLTDGDVWNADHVLSVAEFCQENCEIHTLGLGSGVSTALLQRLAAKGGGSASFLADGEEEDLQETVVNMLSAALQPPVTNLQVHWPSTGPLQPAELEVKKPIHSQGLFQEGEVQRPSELLGESNAEEKQKKMQKIRKENIRRFSDQGGFLRPVQVGARLPPVRSGQRWSGYAFLGFMNESEIPTHIKMTGKMNDQDFELELPVLQSTGRTLHALAAWHMSVILSSGSPWPQLAAGHGLTHWEDPEWQIVALGITYQIATSGTSWIAADEKFLAAPEQEREAAANPDIALGSGLSLRSFARLGSALSVLDFVNLGSSLSVRSFCRVGSSLSIYGMARFGSTFSVLDFAESSSFSIRGFCRLGSVSHSGLTRIGSTFSVLDLVSCGSSMSIKKFGVYASGVSISTFSTLGTSQGILDVGQMTSALSVSASNISGAWMFICMTISRKVAVPVAMIQMVTESAGAAICSHVVLHRNVTPVLALLKNATGLALSFPAQVTSFVDVSNVSGKVDIEVAPNCTFKSPFQPPIRLDDPHLRSQARSELDFVDEQELEELEPMLEMDVSKWGCPMLPKAAYFALLDSQRADGRFDWPVRFFQHLQQGLEGAAWPFSAKVSETLPTAVAIAALRRCFPSSAALVERKACAWLRTTVSTSKVEQLVSFANAAVLQKFMWKVQP